MVKLMIKWLQVLVLGAGLLVAAGSIAEEEAAGQAAADEQASEEQVVYDTEVEVKRPGYGAVLIDTLVARPLGVVGTALGAVVWVVTLPFTAVTGTVGEAGQSLVVDPAAATFYRCLGCFESGWRKLPPADVD